MCPSRVETTPDLPDTQHTQHTQHAPRPQTQANIPEPEPQRQRTPHNATHHLFSLNPPLTKHHHTTPNTKTTTTPPQPARSGMVWDTVCERVPRALFRKQGRDTVCNFCGQRMEVPNEYFCSLDEHGQRRDLLERPEFQRGTVDYLAPRDYSEGCALWLQKSRVIPSEFIISFAAQAHAGRHRALSWSSTSSQRTMQTGFFQQVLVTLRSEMKLVSLRLIKHIGIWS